MKLSSFFLLTFFLISGQVAQAESDAVTYHEHIAPIMFENCSGCHREGESAPFPLTSYDEVSRKARTIQLVVEDRYMPPWHANPETTHFLDVRTLEDDQISAIASWIDAGKPEGDPELAPPFPDFPKGWQLGEPDLILTMSEAFPVPADGPDLYRNFVLPMELPKDKWVKAIELRPSARAVVHHSLYFLDDTGNARELDGQDGQPGFRSMAFRRSGSLGGYVPGVSPRKLPEDLARPLPKGSDLILSTHFHPSGKPEMEQTTVGIYFADAPPSRTLQEVQVPPAFGRGVGINIPAGESNYLIEDEFTLPVAAETIAVSGHAHYICSSMLMTARFPDGTEKILLDIPDWDLDWQDTYFFAEPMILPAGTVVRSEIRYDNSAANPSNPFSPPQRIKWGRESTDEMGSITLLLVPEKEEEFQKLSRQTRVQRVQVLADLARQLQSSGVANRLSSIIALLDRNSDGSLQKEELPPRMRDSLLLGLDINQDDTLNPPEIEKLKDLLGSQSVSEEA